MKNMKYFPFERNKYFYGKLLTVDDFEIEQRYMNDKRRVINRFLHGCGVVCGMRVVIVDDITISVEPGLALDFSGREIVIDTPVLKKLTMIEGFDAFMRKENENPYFYLCLDYEEREREKVHNITGAVGEAYNRYQEGYRLTISDREPALEDLSNNSFFETTKTVYSGNGIHIKQTVPKYVSVGEELEFKVIIENRGQMQPIRFTYDMQLECLEHAGSDTIEISFDEEMYDKKYRYEQTYRIKASHICEEEGWMEVIKERFRLYIGDHRVETRVVYKCSVQIVEGNVWDRIQADYYENAMEDIIRSNYQQSIYLAKIFVLRAGDSYIIDTIEEMPFSQFVYNDVLSDIANRLQWKDMQKMENIQQIPSMDKKEMRTIAQEMPDLPKISTGSVILDLGISGTKGQRFFSDEILHELGLGKVTIVLGQCETTNGEGSIVFGSQEVFEDDAPFRAELAAKTNPETGTFRIGMRLIEPTMARYVKISWTAISNPKDRTADVEEMAMFIKPENLYLKTKESYYLEVKFKGVEPMNVNWEVIEENGGTIDKNGKYTAPNVQGIYEVRATSTIYKNMKASIYVVVRDI